jgi:NifU-like protein involved in Fe-S cluster formation
MTDLYNRDILRLASSLVSENKLDNPHGSAEVDSRTCGSRIAADVILDIEGRVEQVAFRARACAVGQASVAILQRNAAGLTYDKIANIRRDIGSFLSGAKAMPDDWPQLLQLSNVREYPARHAALLLPYDALLAAMEKVR